MSEREKKRKRTGFLGHFDSTNFGNESTLQAILYSLHLVKPDAAIRICMRPIVAAATYHVKAIPLAEPFLTS